MTSYVARLAEKTSWSFDFILWELPFTEGLRLLDYHVWVAGKTLRWSDDLIDIDAI